MSNTRKTQEVMEGVAQIIGVFISAVLLFNAVPHLIQGICGKKHMTPFSARSGAAANVLWGWCNLVAGGLLARAFHRETWHTGTWAVFCAGGVFISLFLAVFWSNPEARLPWHKR